MHFPFFGSEKKVNVLDQPFNQNNAAHVALVMQKLDEFKGAQDNLMNVDGKIALAIGADTLLYATGFLGMFTTTLLLAAIGYIGISKFNRLDLAKDFSSKLNSMMDIFHWILKDKGVDITKLDMFMDVADVIAPYVQTSELMPWDFSRTNPDNLSDRYIQLLSQSPHRVQLTMIKKESALSAMFRALPSAASNHEPAVVVPFLSQVTEKGRAGISMFKQTHAEATRVIYAYSPRP